jgi:hypothetical protein
MVSEVSVSPWLLGPMGLDLRQGRISWQGPCGRAKLLSLWQPTSKKRKKKRLESPYPL